MKRVWLWLWGVGVFCAVVVAVIWLMVPGKEGKPVDSVVAVVSFSGGLCFNPVTEEGELCYSEFLFYESGVVQDEEGSLVGTLDKGDVERLVGLVEGSDLESSFVPVEQPHCPSYADGSDMGVSFPGKYGDKVWVLCEFEQVGDEELIVFLSEVLDRLRN